MHGAVHSVSKIFWSIELNKLINQSIDQRLMFENRYYIHLRWPCYLLLVLLTNPLHLHSRILGVSEVQPASWQRGGGGRYRTTEKMKYKTHDSCRHSRKNVQMHTLCYFVSSAKGSCKVLLSGFFPLRGGVPLNSAKLFWQNYFLLVGRGRRAQWANLGDEAR